MFTSRSTMLDGWRRPTLMRTRVRRSSAARFSLMCSAFGKLESARVNLLMASYRLFLGSPRQTGDVQRAASWTTYGIGDVVCLTYDPGQGMTIGAGTALGGRTR